MIKMLSSYFKILLILISISSLASIFLLFKYQSFSRQDRTYSSYLYHMSPSSSLLHSIYNKTDELIVNTFKKISNDLNRKQNVNNNNNNNDVNVKYVKCNILSQNDLDCVRTDKDVYLPFDVMRKKFDLQLKQNETSFNVSFGLSKVYYPEKNYNSSEEYLWFSNIFVEPRDRVKQISLKHGVPISSQWNKNGHIYPIQVCQFGLSHFSRWIISKQNSGSSYSRNFLVEGKSKFIHHENEIARVNSFQNGFQFKFKDKAIYKTNYTFDIRYIAAMIKTNSYFELKFDLMLRDIELISGNYIVRLIYAFKHNTNDSINEESFAKIIDNDQTYKIIYHISTDLTNRPLKFIRNICLDACKALQLKCENCYKLLNETMIINNATGVNNHTFISQYYKIYQISLKGEGSILDGVLSETGSNYDLAKLAGDYLVESQSTVTGGWPINVVRKFDSKSNVYLKPGWYSAMAQGHALSLLCRLYNHTNDEKYLKSAIQALKLFEKNVENDGLRAYFLNSSLVWYEEYPTRPSSLFVLNGFLYSLFGLNDFVHACSVNSDNNLMKAKSMFLNGVNSLHKMINLYDTGTRTFYDLRHLINPIVNPNVARWDYHALHVSQLNYLVNIIKNQYSQDGMSNLVRSLKDVADRWYEYMKGISNKNTQIKFL